MNRQSLIPSTDTRDIEPKVPAFPANLPSSEYSENLPNDIRIQNLRETQSDSDGSDVPDDQDRSEGAVIEENKDKNSYGNPKKENKKVVKKETSLFLKMILSIVIIAAIIGIGILLPIKLIPSISGMLASVFHGSATTTPATSTGGVTATPNRLASGQQTKIAWGGAVHDKGKYALSYPCLPGITVTLIAADNSTPEITCGVPFYFLSMDNTMTLKIDATDRRLSTIPFTFSYLDENEKATQIGDVTVTLANQENLTGDNTGQVVVGNIGNSGNTSTANVSGGFTETSQGGDSSNTTQTAAQNTTTTKPNGNYYFQTAYQTETNSSPTPTPAPAPAPAPAPSTSVFDTYRTTGSGGSTYTGASSGSGASAGSVTSVASVTSVTGGKPDFVIHIVATGILDPYTNTFIPRTGINSTDRAAVQFEIENVGSGATGAWQFGAVIPTPTPKNYLSGAEPSLNPGNGIILTLGFDGIRSGSGIPLTIQADPYLQIAESNESNNVATAAFYVNYNGVNSNVNTGTSNTSNSGPDLKATVLDVGRLSNGSFVSDDSLQSGDDAIIKFKVTNIGDSASGNWQFEATKTVDNSDRTYTSDTQSSLASGQSKILYLTYNNIDSGNYDMEVIVDPNHDTDDTNRNNNDFTESFDVN